MHLQVETKLKVEGIKIINSRHHSACDEIMIQSENIQETTDHR